MKKLYTLTICLVLFGAANAQKVAKSAAPKNIQVFEKASKGKISENKGITIWSNDFSNASEWVDINFPNGTPAHTAGDWIITNDLDAAPRPELTPAGHTSAANGYAFINSDGAGGNATQNAAIYCNVPINLSGYPTVSLTFQQTHRRYAESTFVIYSTDGGVTWGEVEVNTDMTVNTNTSNPDELQVNLSNEIGDEPSVLIGLKYIGQWDWFWAVDDMKISTLDEYDLEMTNLYWGSTGFWGARLPYYQIPTSQVTEINFGGIVSNLGSQDQNDVIFTASLAGGAYSGSSAPGTILAGSYDTLEVTAALIPPTTPALHTINLNASSAATDAVPANNSIPNFASLSVNPFVYARDKGVLVSGSYNEGFGFEVGNIFDIFTNTTIGGGSVYIHPGAVVGAEIYLKLYSIDPVTGDFMFVDESGSYVLEATDLDAAVTLSFLGGNQPLNEGESYLLVAGSNGDGGATNDLIVGTSGVSEPQTSFYLDLTDNTWYYTTSTSMVRMNFDPALGVNEANNTFGLEVAPNPAADATSITFTVKNTSDASITVIDMAGKVVANQSLSGVNGTQVIEINTSALNSGMYTVNVTANGTTVCKKLAIRK